MTNDGDDDYDVSKQRKSTRKRKNAEQIEIRNEINGENTNSENVRVNVHRSAQEKQEEITDTSTDLRNRRKEREYVIALMCYRLKIISWNPDDAYEFHSNKVKNVDLRQFIKLESVNLVDAIKNDFNVTSLNRISRDALSDACIARVHYDRESGQFTVDTRIPATDENVPSQIQVG